MYNELNIELPAGYAAFTNYGRRTPEIAVELYWQGTWLATALNRPKIIGGRMDWIRQLCLIRLFGDSTSLQILLAECSRWNSAVGAG